MTKTLPKIFTFDEFIEWLPENSGKRYELHDGIIVEMSQPSVKHKKVTRFLAGEITVEYKRAIKMIDRVIKLGNIKLTDSLALVLLELSTYKNIQSLL